MTGYLHDPGCFADHDSAHHPENSGRLSQIQTAGMTPSLPWRPATDEELLAVHTPAHLQLIDSTGSGMLDADTYCCPQSKIIARNAAGSLVDLCLKVLDGSFSNGLALVRPPGHHATADEPMGFCLFNNVAVAAAALINNGLSRVAIVDFDVHHGNGTQDIFYEDDAVLYISSHQYPHYPGSGSASETGRGKGAGFTLNHPLQAGSGDDEFLTAYENNLLPALVKFDPEFILISAGYDAHEDDPLAGLNVTTDGFTTLTKRLVQTAADSCGGKIVFALEGGYNAQALAECIEATTMVLSEIGNK